jgi:outer membrane protein assembly factor BamB
MLLGILIFNCNYLFGQNSIAPNATSNIKITDYDKLPTMHWKFKTNMPLFSSPVISENVVFVGSLDSTLYAVDLATGKLKWKFKTGGQIRSTVSMQGDQLFLYSGDAILYCLSKTSGKVLWSFKTIGGILGERLYDFADYFQSSPVYHNKRIFFGAGDGYVYAIDYNSGKLCWSFKAGEIIHTTPSLYKDRLFIGSFDGNLYALRQEDGSLLWKFKTVGHRYFPTGQVQGNPVAKNDLVYFGARDYNFYAIDVFGGHCHWNKSFLFGWAMAATTGDSAIYLGTSDDRILLALDSKTGQELWRTDVKFNIFGPPATSASIVYVGTLMGKIYGIDRKNGNIKWVFTTEGYKSNHLKYFNPDDTFRKDISNLIKTPADFIGMEYKLGAIFSTPAITEDFIVVSSTDGNIYCLKR